MDYVLYIGVMISLYAILATSFNLLIGFGGLFALSHAAFYAFGAYATAILTTQLGWPFPLPMIAGIAFSAGVGALVALPALRVSGVYLVIVTLALQIIVVQILNNGGEFTGGTDGITGVPSLALGGVTLDSPGRFLPLAVAFAAACFWVAHRLGHSPFGRGLKAMRENEPAAQAAGKDVVYMKLVVFAFAAGLAAVAGSLFAHYFQYVGPQSFTIEETIYILAMVIVGGTGNLWGSAAGASLLVLLPEALEFVELPSEIADKSRLLIYGLLLILILRFRPQGLFGERASTGRVHAGAAQASTDNPGPAVSRNDPVSVVGKGLHKSFGGVVAVADLDIELPSGRVTGLVGPNGAGKTTAFNLLTGFLKPDRGTIEVNGRDVTGLKPHRIVHAGMARSFQDLRLFRRMTVLENVLVALPEQSGDRVAAVYLKPRQVRREERENVGRAMEVLDFVGLSAKADEPAEDLSYAEEKLLVIARLLATGAGVLLFDEPLSGLDPATLHALLPTIRKLAEHGKTVCIIEHNLDVIKGVCDVVFFLDEARVVAVGPPEQLMSDPALAARYFK